MLTKSLASAIDKLQLRPEIEQNEVAALIVEYLEDGFCISGEISESDYLILEAVDHAVCGSSRDCGLN